MERNKKLLEKISLKANMINGIIGAVLIVSLLFIFLNPYNRYAILTASIAGGMMNMVNGLRMMTGANRSTGASMVMTGFILIILGFVIIQFL